MSFKLDRAAGFAWGVLAYNLFVILWGAFVRATGSGAGCGSHWPLCNGEVIPRADSIQTLIEFGHRLTSGVALLGVIALVVWSRRARPPGHLMRRGAIASLIFIIIEALLGAGLVLFELVAHNASVTRAFSMSAHLLNTFLLVAALTLTAWWASGGGALRLRGNGPLVLRLGLGAAGVLLVGMSGAITALGDTLFPAASLAEGIQQDLAPAAHFAIRLRVLHPVLAVLTSVYVVYTAWNVQAGRGSLLRNVAIGVTAVFALQLGVGVANMLLLAPIWIQLVHLLLADLLWMALVIMAAVALAAHEPAAAPQPVAAGMRAT